MKTIELGDAVRDNVSGFAGVVTAITNYLQDTPSYRVTRTDICDGEVKQEWFPYGRLEIVRPEQCQPDPCRPELD